MAAAFLGALACNAALTVTAEPRELFVGEQGQLQIASDEGMPKDAQLPKIPGIEWVAGPFPRSETQIVNFKRTYRGSITYQFRATRAGALTIPPITVTIDGGARRTDPVAVTVRERSAQTPDGKKLAMADMLFGELVINGKTEPPGNLFVGEEFDLEIIVWAYEKLNPTHTAYPELQIEDVAVADFSRTNPREMKEKRFAPGTYGRRIRDAVPFTVYHYETRLTPLTAGTLSGKVVAHIGFVVQKQRPRGRPRSLFFNDFWGSGRSVEQRSLGLTMPSVPVRPLPPPTPQDGTYIGLIGRWDLDLTTTPGKVRVGEPVTVTLEVRGSGSVATLKAPVPDFEGFRVYDPEVKRNGEGGQGSTTVTWVLIPLAETARPPEFRVSTFDPEAAAYVTETFRTAFEILPPVASQPPPSPHSFAPPTPGQLASDPAEQRQAANILYVKPALGSYVKRPLWRNSAAPTVAAAATGLLAYAAFVLAANRRERLRGSQSYRRRRQALRSRRRMLRRLRACPAAEGPAVVRTDVVPYLNALLDLPPGTTASALAQHVEPRAPEIAGALRTADDEGFMPTPGQHIDARRLARQIARLTAIAALLAAAALPVAAEPAAVGLVEVDRDMAASAPPTIAAATVAYDRGDYARAAAIYEALGRADAENARLLYNRGNCAHMLGDGPAAVALYERARRLAPRDSDILENLNFVRDGLGLPPTGQAQSPRELLLKLRDLLRPDEWMLVAAVAVLLAGVGAGWCRWRRRGQAGVLVPAAVLLLLAVLAWRTQFRTTYAPSGQGVVASNQAAAYAVPGADAPKADFVLRAGEVVHIQETRTDWLRIRIDSAEGWVRRGSILPVW